MPQDISDLHAAAEAALSNGKFSVARELARSLTTVDPLTARGYFLLGMAEAGLGHPAVAIEALRKAVRLSPGPDYLAQLARLLVLLRREAEARATADLACAAKPQDALTHDTIGCVYARLNQHEASVRLFERAVAGAPDNISFRFNLASSLGFLGRFAEAAEHYEAIIARDAGFGRAHLGLAGMAKQTQQCNHIRRLEEVLVTLSNPIERLRVHYAAAKEYEDLSDFRSAFHHLATANSAHKAHIGYDIGTDRLLFDQLQACFTKPSHFAGDSAVEDAPIFVVGMPRTGTTLVDRILSSHPRVLSAGELQAMPVAVKRLAATRSRLVLDGETIDASGALTPGAVGRAYMEHAGVHRRPDADRFIDKLPLNFLYLGYIARALPNASIVCLRRNPMDSVWSNFKNLFATTSHYYRYSYDLHDTAAYYLMFDRMMAFWHTLLPGRVLDVHYERLVADQEAETRRLLDHCRLDWSDACLRFYENTTAVSTPSSGQVRQPIYRHAVGRWRAYAAELEPVRAYFERAGVSTS